MIKQIFSAKQFQEIFDSENRKGFDVELKFEDSFTQSITSRNEIKNISKKIKQIQNKDDKYGLQVEKRELKDERNEKIHEILEQIAETINKSNFSINICEGDVYGKTSYYLEKTVENFFVSKQIQRNILRTYKIHQSSRYEIISALKNLLDDTFPKIIVRTDVKNFYESIPQKCILQKIKDDNLLSIKTQWFIEKILNGYNAITNQNEDCKGVPRGIGISAYLSELYMRTIDNKIKELSDIIFYARYVDDIIAVFVPQKIEKNLTERYRNDLAERYKNDICSIITENNLLPNEKKTTSIDLLNKLDKLNQIPIEFLGYKIYSNQKGLSINMSDSKLNKYKNKIKLAYEHFAKKKHHNRRRAFKLLLARMDYLTTNTKLRNNKSKVFVGIYYSNPFLTNCDSLTKLNKSNQWRISRGGFTNEEKEKLSECDFQKGFENRIFRKLPLIKKIYKNHNGKQPNNKGIVQFGISEITKIWKNA